MVNSYSLLLFNSSELKASTFDRLNIDLQTESQRTLDKIYHSADLNAVLTRQQQNPMRNVGTFNTWPPQMMAQPREECDWFS